MWAVKDSVILELYGSFMWAELQNKLSKNIKRDNYFACCLQPHFL